MDVKTQIVSAQWLKEYLGNPDLIVLDTSEKENKSGLESAHEGLQIKGARYFDLQDKFSEKCDLPHTLVSPEIFEKESRALGINSSSQIIVYDKLGIYYSPRVWWMFKAMGHENVAVLNGGLPAWVAEGGETEPIQKRNYTPGNFKADFQPQMVKNLGFIKENLKSRRELVVDARSAGRFKGTAAEPRAGLSSGHMPNSKNVPFPEVLENGKFKSVEELRKIFSNILKEGKPLVFSCGSGLTACITYLACDLVDDSPKSVYDGSWTEYVQAEGLPVEKEV